VKVHLKCFYEYVTFVECYIADRSYKPAEVDETEIDGMYL